MSGCSLLPSAAANLLHNGAWRASSPSSAHPLLATAACSCTARVPDRPLARHSHIRGSPRAACSLCPPLRLGTNVDASLPPPTTHGCSPSSAGRVTRLPPTRRALPTVGLVYRPPPPSRLVPVQWWFGVGIRALASVCVVLVGVG